MSEQHQPNQEKMEIIKTEVDDFLYNQQEVKIVNKEDYTKAGDMLKVINGKVKQLEAKRKEYTMPLLEQKRMIDGDFKSIIKPLEEFIKKVKTEMVVYHQYEQEQLEIEQKKLEVEALEKARKEGKTEVEVPIVTDNKTNRGEASTSTVKKIWKFEVIADNEVPREYLSVDESKIRADVSRGTRQIAGVKIFQEDNITIR